MDPGIFGPTGLMLNHSAGLPTPHLLLQTVRPVLDLYWKFTCIYHNLPRNSRINASDRKMVSKLTGAVLTSENCLMYWLLEEEKEKGVRFNTKRLNADKFTWWTFWHRS